MSFYSKYRKGGDPNRRASVTFLEMTKTYLSPMTIATLRDQVRVNGLPMSRLIAIAIDNELDVERPFTYATDTLNEEYQEYLYIKEANTLLAFICKFPKGIGRDLMLLCRRDLNMDKPTILRALRELLEKEMVEEIIPTDGKFNMWLTDYRVIRALDIQVRERKPKKYKKIEGVSTKGQRRIADNEVER